MQAEMCNPLRFHFLNPRGKLPFTKLENKVFLLVRLAAKLLILG